jgi:alpha-tubulin suppressor-like RCC1 family protein
MRPRLTRLTQLALLATVLAACSAAAPAGAATPQVSVGYYHSCAVELSGTVKCFGQNEYGEAGSNNVGGFVQPTVIDLGGAKATSVAASDSTSCASLESGGVKCWGRGTNGELGDGNSASSVAPVDATIGGFAREVVQSSYSFCALMDGGGVKCWGVGSAGTTGSGSTDEQPIPVGVDLGGNQAVSISAGYSKVCVLTQSAEIWCWGSNGYAEIADVATNPILSPTRVDLGGPAPLAVATDYEHICALITGGTVKCWGGNYTGQLGDGTDNDAPIATPVTVELGEPAVSISVGWYHTCAQLQSGVVKCWGENDYGQLGALDPTDQYLPIEYNAHSGPISKLFAGAGATCVSLTTGALECTGYYVPYYMDESASGYSQFGPLLIAGVDMSLPTPPAPPTPAGPSTIAGKIAKPKWALTRKGSTITAKSTISVTATGMDATHCVGKLQVSVPSSSSMGTKTAPTFALKHANGKCTASAKRSVPLRVARKGLRLKVYLKNAPLLTATSVTSTTKLPKAN